MPIDEVVIGTPEQQEALKELLTINAKVAHYAPLVQEAVTGKRDTPFRVAYGDIEEESRTLFRSKLSSAVKRLLTAAAKKDKAKQDDAKRFFVSGKSDATECLVAWPTRG